MYRLIYLILIGISSIISTGYAETVEHFKIELPRSYNFVNVDITVQSMPPAALTFFIIKVSKAKSFTTISTTQGILKNIKIPKGRRVWLNTDTLDFTAEFCPVQGLPACDDSSGSLYFLKVLKRSIVDANSISASAVVNTDYRGTNNLNVELSVGEEVNDYLSKTLDPTPISSQHYFMFDSSWNSFNVFTTLLNSIAKGDAITFHGLQGVYNTPLKVKLFKKTQEYKKLKKSMLLRKKEILNNNKYCHPVELSNYDLKRKGFTVEKGLREGDDTLDVSGFRKNKTRELRGLRDFIRVKESIAADIENIKVSLCFKFKRIKPVVRLNKYKVSKAVMRLLNRRQRAFARKNPITIRYKKYRVEATHLVLGNLKYPDEVYRIKKGIIVQ